MMSFVFHILTLEGTHNIIYNRWIFCLYTPNIMKIKIRRKWKINPRSRIRESKKLYSRKREKLKFHKELREGDGN